MKLLKILNLDNVSEEEILNYEHRKAVRIIAFDNERRVAFIHAVKNGYYELPGGGVEDNESLEEGAVRETKEEAGCDIKITGEVGIFKEYIKNKNLINETFCYTAEVINEKGNTSLMQDEIAEDKIVIWVDLEEAIRLIRTNPHPDLYPDSIVRDETFMLNLQIL